MSIASKDKHGHSVPLRLCLQSFACQVLGLIADDINPASHGHGGSLPGLFLTFSVPLSSDCLHFYHRTLNTLGFQETKGILEAPFSHVCAFAMVWASILQRLG